MSLVPVTIFLMHVCMLSHFSRVWRFVTPWTVVHQPPLSNGPVQQARMLEWAAMSSSRGSSQPGTEWASFMFPALGFFFFFLVVFAIHWHESAMDLHVFPIPIPPPASLSIPSLWVFPVHQPWALVSLHWVLYHLMPTGKSHLSDTLCMYIISYIVSLYQQNITSLKIKNNLPVLLKVRFRSVPSALYKINQCVCL